MQENFFSVFFIWGMGYVLYFIVYLELLIGGVDTMRIMSLKLAMCSLNFAYTERTHSQSSVDRMFI